MPQIVVSYHQWDAKEVTYAVPVLGPLAWIVGGPPKCIGCGTALNIASLPAFNALCNRCHDLVTQASWTCCEQVTTGEEPACHTPLRSPPCMRTSQDVPTPAFACVPSCLEQHELIALWFAPGKARILVIPSNRVNAAIAASGALVARRYHMRGRFTFLEDWAQVVIHLQNSHLFTGRAWRVLPLHQTLSIESLASLNLFTDTPVTKQDDLRDAAEREFFRPIEDQLNHFHAVPFAETFAPRRYFLPRRLSRRRLTLEMPPSGNFLSIIGSGVGAWGPWFFIRGLDGIIVQINCATLLGRSLTDSPSLLAAQDMYPLAPLQEGEEIPSSTGSARVSIHAEGGE